MLFAAFISYKHIEPDRKWAAWLHKKLETYRVPRGIPAPQLGTRRIGRVFRDDEELAAGDLSGAIKAALANSEYLIVVCSPSTPASDYVNQEIREFAALGRPEKILALLVSGEPSDSFPAALRECAPEPLAADVRTNTARSLNQAFLRIMAALLNCTFDQLRQRERQRTKRRIQFVSAIIAICVFLVAAIRYGLNRLSLERTSIGTYDLLVKPGINFLKPLLGSDQTSIEVSDKLFHLSPRGQAPFAGGSSLLFPALDPRRLFEWLNVYYLEELRQSPNKKADIADFFIEQIRVNDPSGESELIEATREGAPFAYETVVAHRLTGDRYRAALLQALNGSPEPKTKALTLNVIQDLYGDDPATRDLTQGAISRCDENAVKVAMALSYSPDPVFLAYCASKSLSEKRWKDAAALVVRYQLPTETLLPWMILALSSTTPDEFLAAANIVVGRRINDPQTVRLLEKRLPDADKNVKAAAAQTLWSLGEDSQSVREIIRGLLAGPTPANYVALLQSRLSDDEITRSLERQLTGVHAGDFAFGWLLDRPEAIDVLVHLAYKGTANEVCLSPERATRTEDYNQALLTARAIMLGCRDKALLKALDSYVWLGTPGLLGVMIDPKISEAYGSMLIEDDRETCANGVERLWSLLISPRSEASASYRLAVQYALARLVVRGTTDAEIRRCQTAVSERTRIWATDEVPHHRAAFVNLSKLIREEIDKKELLLLRTDF